MLPCLMTHIAVPRMLAVPARKARLGKARTRPVRLSERKSRKDAAPGISLVCSPTFLRGHRASPDV